MNTTRSGNLHEVMHQAAWDSATVSKETSMTDKEAMKLALDALELVNIEFVCNGAHHAKKDRHGLDEDCPVTMRYRKAITALKERLAQPEQEPVQEIVPEGVITAIRNEGLTLVKDLRGYRLMRLGKVEAQATPPQRTWVDLSDTQIEQVYFDVVKEHRGAPMPWGQVQFGRALLNKFKEKNNGQ
jgi:hypothetical protein